MSSTGYPIFLIYSEEDQAWLARVDQLGGCVVDGKTPEEALANARKAIDVWIEVSQELDREIPTPLTVERLESLQGEAIAKQQELFQNAVRQVADDVLRQFQSSKLQQVSGVSLGSDVRIAGFMGPLPDRGFVKAI